MFRESRAPWALLGLLLATLAMAGCSGDDEDDGGTTGPEVPDRPVPLATTPDQLVANFRTVYAAGDSALYDEYVLHPDFTFVLQEGTVDEFGLPDRFLDRQQDLSSSGRMFAGRPGMDGQRVDRIVIERLQAGASAWDDVGEGDPWFAAVPDAVVMLYNVKLDFVLQGQEVPRIPEGSVTFYAAPVTIQEDGEPHTVYRLLGQVDLTQGKASEQVSWGAMKALYLP